MWATPPVFSDGNLLTASQLNTLSGDLNETAVGLATTAGAFFAADGVNSLAERIPATGSITTLETGTLTTFGNITTAGPDANGSASGTTALVILTAGIRNNTVDAETFYGYSISVATTFAADVNNAMRHTSATANAELTATWAHLVTGLTPGVNNYRARYQVSSGTGSWFDRRISVVPF